MSLPHRSRVFELLSQTTRPLHVSEIGGRLGVEPHSMHALGAMLDDMVFSGTVRAYPGHRYRIGEHVAVVETETGARSVKQRQGVFTLNPRGFGFVASQGTGDPDVFIAPEDVGGALHGDQVVVRIQRTDSKGPAGLIVSVSKRGVKRVPGTLRRRGRSTWLEPDDARMRGPIPLKTDAGHDGDAVVATITRYPETRDELPEAELATVLGRPGEPKVEVEKILAREEIVETFPPDVVEEARAFGAQVTADQIAGREDLRAIPLCTIDPPDARDHDDAVFVRRATPEEGEEAAYVAWIAIADVSHYVRPGTPLDRESRHRGCSIYLPDRAIPMLPRELSSHLCSLIEGEDRLCMAVEVVLDATAQPLRRRLVEGVMKSRAKLSYDDVAKAMKFVEEGEPSEKALALLPDLQTAWELSGLLRARRMRRGALDFDLPEPKVKLDAHGLATDIVKQKANPGIKKAYSLIEELMLLANEVVAEELSGRTIPTVYRVHGVPDEERLEAFASMAQTLGLGFKIEDARDPKSLGKFLKIVATHARADILNNLLLRAMKQATYDIVNIGHFGLASKAYLHFTSPIRRYPDLVVHRAVHAMIHGQSIRRDEKALETLKEAASAASTAERKAMEIEREVVDLHRALLMRSHLGEEFEGMVTALVGSGIFVAIDAPFVDVMVKYELLGDDTYELDDEKMAAIGRRSGDTVRLGDRIVVRIEDVSIERRSVYGRRLFVAGAATETDRPTRSVRAAKSSTRDRGPRRDPHGKKAAAAAVGKDAKKEKQRKAREGKKREDLARQEARKKGRKRR